MCKAILFLHSHSMAAHSQMHQQGKLLQSLPGCVRLFIVCWSKRANPAILFMSKKAKHNFVFCLVAHFGRICLMINTQALSRLASPTLAFPASRRETQSHQHDESPRFSPSNHTHGCMKRAETVTEKHILQYYYDRT